MHNGFTLPVDAILLIGPTASGKSPLGDLIAARGLLGKRTHHLDFGAELRALASGNSSSSFSPEELSYIVGVLKHGLLLENDHFPLARKILTRALERSHFLDGDLLVLNGIPRHAGQARDISSLAIVNALVVLDCSEEAVLCRLRDNVGGDRTGRTDDVRELVLRKLRTFQERTEPLIHHYERNGSMVYRISISDRTTTNDAYFQLSSLAAAYPPFSFITEPPQGGVRLQDDL